MGDTKETKGAVITQTPDVKGGETPQKTPTLTQEEADALVAKAVQNTKTDLGRLETELKRSQSISEAALRRLKERDEDDFRRQEEAVRDDPDKLSAIRRARQVAEREAELSQERENVKAQSTKVLTVHARNLSKQYNVSEETILKYGGGDADAMEELAKSYGERKVEGEPETKPVKRMTEPPDGGETKGGGAGLTAKDVAKMSPEEQNKRNKEIAAIPFSEVLK